MKILVLIGFMSISAGFAMAKDAEGLTQKPSVAMVSVADKSKHRESKKNVSLHNYKNGKIEEIINPLSMSWEKAREFVPQESELMEMMDAYQAANTTKPIKAAIKTLAIYLEAIVEQSFQGKDSPEAEIAKTMLLEKIEAISDI